MTASTGDRQGFELCNRTWMAIVDRAGEQPKAADFTREERTVVLVWTVLGIVGNGGFEYLFSDNLPGDPDYRFTIEAFREIGADDAAGAIQAALAGFPGQQVPKEIHRRRQAFRAVPESERDRLASRFFGAEDETVTQLADYIRLHDLGR